MNANPGDLVAYDAGLDCCICDDDAPSGKFVGGRVYRVVAVYFDEHGRLYDFAEAPIPDGGWCDRHFRKLNDAADDAKLVARIKNCRPAKTGVSA